MSDEMPAPEGMAGAMIWFDELNKHYWRRWMTHVASDAAQGPAREPQRPGKHRLRTPFPMPAPEVLDAMARYLYKHYRRRWMTPTNTLEEAIEAYRKLKVFEKASAPRRTGEDDPSEPVPPPVQA